MTIAALNGVELVRWHIVRPSWGHARCDVLVGDDLDSLGVSQGSSVTLELAGETVLTAKAWRVERQGGLTRVVGMDAYGLRQTVSAKYYQQPSSDAGLVARDILSECGETLVDVQINTAFNRYVRGNRVGSQELTLLCSRVGAIWRTTRDGTVTVIPSEPYPENATSLEWGDSLLALEAGCGALECLSRPDVLPGQVIGANPYGEDRTVIVVRVEHSGAHGKARTMVYPET